jgi:DNA-binding HxlR family transcriptional regulator
VKRREKSACPVAFFLDLFGDRWTLLVLRDLLTREKRCYRDFINPTEKIATNILADRLKLLVSQGLVTRRDDPDNKSKTLYTPTAKALALKPVLEEMAKWGRDYGPESLARPARSAAGHSQSGEIV